MRILLALLFCLGLACGSSDPQPVDAADDVAVPDTGSEDATDDAVAADDADAAEDAMAESDAAGDATAD